jgi:hypothetical protein
VGRQPFLACVVASAVLAAAGCGGSSSPRLSGADYKAKIAAIGKEADTAQTKVETAMQAKTTTSLAAILTAFSSAEEKMSKEVAGLNPPQDAQAANDQLAKGLHDISQATSDVLPQIRSAANPAAAIAILNKSSDGQKAGQELDQAITKLKSLGYTTGS